MKAASMPLFNRSLSDAPTDLPELDYKHQKLHDIDEDLVNHAWSMRVKVDPVKRADIVGLEHVWRRLDENIL